MADAGAAGSSVVGEGNPEYDTSYFGALSSQFAARHGVWKQETHNPQTKEEYAESLLTSQTNTCTGIAARHYQSIMGTNLEKVVGIDSHMFSCKWVIPEDRRLCFHVNFSAYIVGGDQRKRFFFAELVGNNRPESVNTCLMFGGTKKHSVSVCHFCTGMWHPVSDDFMGHQQSTPPVVS
ncbi:hypothetical protein ACP70R_029558 [Stipagrostis hirtigluma subsp. patula]